AAILLAGCARGECGAGAEEGQRGGPAPTEVSASSDAVAHVLVSWELQEGAAPDAFEVYRDDELVATLLSTARSYADVGASPGTVRAGAFEARGSLEGIALDWEAAAVA